MEVAFLLRAPLPRSVTIAPLSLSPDALLRCHLYHHLPSVPYYILLFWAGPPTCRLMFHTTTFVRRILGTA